MDKYFPPFITLKRHTISGKVINGYWYVDLVKDFKLARQFIKAAGIKNMGTKIQDSDLDAFSEIAGKNGYSVETIGE